MAKTKKTHKMISEWTYVVSGDKGHWECECTSKRQAESMGTYQVSNLYGYGTDIKIAIEKL